jgi:hypothetical protein
VVWHLRINNNMDKTKIMNEQVEIEYKKKPDEQGGILVEGHIKIFDPESQEIFVNRRA